MAGRSSQVDFSDDRIMRSVALTAFPMLVAQIISLLYNIVDRIYIARIPEVGTEAMAGLGLCFPVIIIITAFTNLFGTGGSPLCSIERGRGNRKEAEHIMNVGALCLLLMSFVLFLICELFCRKLLLLFGADEEALIYSVPYLRIYLFGCTASMISTGLNPYINAQGFTAVGMTTVLIGAVANIILDPVFIFLFGMGIRGAAVATVISQILSAAFVLKFLMGPGAELKLSLIPPRQWAKELPLVKEIASLGLTSFIMQFTNSLVSIACNSMLMAYGGSIYVSVMTLINSLRQIMDAPALSIADGSAPIVSFNYGARNAGKCRRTMKIMFIFTIGYTFTAWIAMLAFPGIFVKIFSSDPELTGAAVPAIRLYFLAFLFQSFQYCGQAVFKAMNKKKQAIFFSLFRKVIMVVPLTLLLPGVFGMGTDGVFAAEPISNFVGGSACFTTMLIMVLSELKRMDEEKTAA